MMDSGQRFGLPRILVRLCFAVALGYALISGARAAEVRLPAEGIGIVAGDDGTVRIADAAGKTQLVIGNYRMAWTPPRTDGGTASLVTTEGGARAVQVDYRIKDDPSGTFRVRARFVPSARRVHLRYDVWAPANVNVAGAMLGVRAADRGVKGRVVKLGWWKRDENGGIPYEIKDRDGLFYEWPGETALVSLNGANMGWLGEGDMHFPPRKDGEGHYVAEGDIVLTGMAAPPESAAAVLGDRPLSLDVTSEKPFHIWDGNDAYLRLDARIVNPTPEARPVALTWWARDFNGKLLREENRTLTLAPRGVWAGPLSFKGPERGIAFVEVQAKSGDFTVFTRTNAAVMPRPLFKSGRESIFGIAAVFPQPTQDDALSLLQRIGVRWLRGSPVNVPVEKYGLYRNYHSNRNRTAAPADPAWFREQLKIADDNGAEFWELGNEWNMAAIGKGTDAEKYVRTLLEPADEMRKATGARVKMMSMGLAGTDEAFIDRIYETGGWPRLDALAIHPGRGNYTADYDGESGTGYEYWNFLGALRHANAKLERYGRKPLYVTEAYASTRPNVVWSDTYRHAAENVVLSYALAMSEGVRVMNFYQFNDSVWHNVGGIDPSDTEYYYGLLNRDLSPKPSLLAYQTVAEALDRARFVRWLTFPDETTKGLLFSTPRGPVHILWSRADGYVLNKNHPQFGSRFAAPETWVDDWKTKVTLDLPVGSGAPVAIDCIGQKTPLAASGGKARVTLDGAPRIVYGLSEKVGE